MAQRPGQRAQLRSFLLNRRHFLTALTTQILPAAPAAKEPIVLLEMAAGAGLRMNAPSSPAMS